MIDKVEIGSCTLYNGDCVEVTQIIKDKIDHTITDPPYDAEAHTSARRVQTAEGMVTQAHKFEAMDAETRATITKFIIERTERWALIFCQVDGNQSWKEKIIECGGRYHSTMIWYKPDAMPNFRGTGPAFGFEAIVTAWCGEGHSSWNGGGRHGHFSISSYDKNAKIEGVNAHTSIKPQKLMTELVGLFSNKDEVIFDPFMGSGSTGVAAATLGRRFIGVERDPEFFEVCCRRIEAAQRVDLVNENVYVKTKAKVAVPLFDPPVKPRAASKAKSASKPVATPKPRFAVPTITVDKAPVKSTQIPWENPFLAWAKPIVDRAKGQPLKFNDWDGSKKNLLGMDVECYRNVLLICFKDFRNGKKYIFERSTRTDFRNEVVRDIMESNKVITFNGNNYDVPMVYLALKGASTQELKSASDRIIKTGMKSWQTERELKITIPRIDHIDLFEPNPAVRMGLKVLMGRMHCEYIFDLPYDEAKSLTADEMNYLTLYCFNDIDGTEELYEYLAEPLELRRQLSNEYKIDMRSKSDAQMGEAIFRKRIGTVGKSKPMTSFFYKIPDFITFNDPQMLKVLDNLVATEFVVDQVNGKTETPAWLEGLEIKYGNALYRMGRGGLHSMESKRALHSTDEVVLVDIDVRSQYPNIGLKLGMYPKAAGPKYIEVGAAIIKERLAAKDRIAEGEEFKVKAEGLKIAANGAMFGKLGSFYSFLYGPDILFAVTMTGQLSVLMLIEQFELAGIPIVSGNTDGVIAACPRGMLDKLNEIVKRWEGITGFEVEKTNYKSIYNRSVNSYFAVKENGKMKRKGDDSNPWAEEDNRGMLSKNPQMTIIGDAVAEYILHKTPFEETISKATDPKQFITVVQAKAGAKWREHPLGSVVRYYWSIDGDPILYINSNRKVANTTGARPMVKLLEELPADLDRERYIRETEKLAVEMAVIEEKGGLL